MRYDTPMYPRKTPRADDGSTYDYESGNYNDSGQEGFAIMASVMPLSDETSRFLFGESRRERLVAHTLVHQRDNLEEFERFRIGEFTYKVIKVRKLRRKCVYYLERVK